MKHSPDIDAIIAEARSRRAQQTGMRQFVGNNAAVSGAQSDHTQLTGMRQSIDSNTTTSEVQSNHTPRTGVVLDPPSWSPITDVGERRRRGAGDTTTNVPEHDEIVSSSSPPASSTNPARGHSREPSDAESLAESLKENDGDPGSRPGVRRPWYQSRGFGNDITQYIDDERERSEAIAANRQT